MLPYRPPTPSATSWSPPGLAAASAFSISAPDGSPISMGAYDAAFPSSVRVNAIAGSLRASPLSLMSSYALSSSCFPLRTYNYTRPLSRRMGLAVGASYLHALGVRSYSVATILYNAGAVPEDAPNIWETSSVTTRLFALLALSLYASDTRTSSSPAPHILFASASRVARK